jgi:hypothetical protein
MLRAGLPRKEESFCADAENGTHLEENQTNHERDTKRSQRSPKDLPTGRKCWVTPPSEIIHPLPSSADGP